MYVIKKVGWLRRLWHVILTKVFKIEVVAYKKNPWKRGNAQDNWLVPHWLCPGCLQYRDWDFGAADGGSDLCDDCWCENTEKMKEELNDHSTRSV